MKKLKLTNLQTEGEILTRDQLKRILGGDGGSGSTTFCSCTCTSTGYSWIYTAKGQPNTPVQPTHEYLQTDTASICGSVSNTTCTGCDNW